MVQVPNTAGSLWNNFGDCAEHYKLGQQAAKKAGKWKTRLFHLALPLRNVQQTRVSFSAANWCATVSIYIYTQARKPANRQFTHVFGKRPPRLLAYRPVLPGERPGAGGPGGRVRAVKGARGGRAGFSWVGKRDSMGWRFQMFTRFGQLKFTWC